MTPVLLGCTRAQDCDAAQLAKPDTDLSSLAASLGYADYAHFSRRYKAVLGASPGSDSRAATIADE